VKDGFYLVTAYGSRFAALLRFLVRPVQAATAAELPELQTLGRRLLVLRRHVVAALALCALQHNVVARHKFTFYF
jgi:hypothetical protein